MTIAKHTAKRSERLFIFFCFYLFCGALSFIRLMEFAQVDEEGVPQFSYEYLLSLSEAQRDEILGSIPFVDEPNTFALVLGDDVGISSIGDIFNYSKCYEAFSPGAKENALNPNLLRSGDIVYNRTSYRGIGAYHCVWLHRDILEVPQDIQINLEAYFSVGATPPIPRVRDDRNTGEHVATPGLVPREADGPHNDADYEVYLFKHPDEYDNGLSAVMTNVPDNYYIQCHEFFFAFVDPLLTHSGAYCYSLIRQCKDSDRWRDDPSFPNAFVGEYDRLCNREDFTAEDMEWYVVEELVERGSIHAITRHVFSEHCRAYHSRSPYVLK